MLDSTQKNYPVFWQQFNKIFEGDQLSQKLNISEIAQLAYILNQVSTDENSYQKVK